MFVLPMLQGAREETILMVVLSILQAILESADTIVRECLVREFGQRVLSESVLSESVLSESVLSECLVREFGQRTIHLYCNKHYAMQT